MYDQEMPQSPTTDQPMAPQGRVIERSQRHGVQNITKVKQPPLFTPARSNHNKDLTTIINKSRTTALERTAVAATAGLKVTLLAKSSP